MSNNPTATLTRPWFIRPKTSAIHFCLATHPKQPGQICTRISGHLRHCCDEVAELSWDAAGVLVRCSDKHDHSLEKGLMSA